MITRHKIIEFRPDQSDQGLKEIKDDKKHMRSMQSDAFI